jgi:hypothetical protein
VYIFALFNENDKGDGPDDIEQNFGLFYPNMQKVYEFDFNGGGALPAPESWCVPNAVFGDERLQGALDWACGHGVDCSAIQPGASCPQSFTKVVHATYAFNDYYQRKGRGSGSCDLAGAASVMYKPQSEFTLVGCLLLLHAHPYMHLEKNGGLTGVSNLVLQRSEISCSHLRMPKRLGLNSTHQETTVMFEKPPPLCSTK